MLKTIVDYKNSINFLIRKYFNENNLGHHWLARKEDTENIVELFTFRDDVEGDPYYIKAHTPSRNVSIPNDYFNNLEENEVLVINDKVLRDIEIFEFKK